MRLLGWSFILSPVLVGFIIMPFAFFSIWKEKRNLLFIITGILGLFLVVFLLTILSLSFLAYYETGSIFSRSMDNYTVFLIGFLTFLTILLFANVYVILVMISIYKVSEIYNIPELKKLLLALIISYALFYVPFLWVYVILSVVLIVLNIMIGITILRSVKV